MHVVHDEASHVPYVYINICTRFHRFQNKESGRRQNRIISSITWRGIFIHAWVGGKITCM